MRIKEKFVDFEELWSRQVAPLVAEVRRLVAPALLGSRQGWEPICSAISEKNYKIEMNF